MYIINQFVDKLEEGIIIINSMGMIDCYNRKAKEIFGIENDYPLSHKSGSIENGDIVIISNNEIGMDDGGLVQEDLKSLGLIEDIEIGDGLLYIGRYGSSPLSKMIIPKDKRSGVKTINARLDNEDILASIDYIGKRLLIAVGDSEFSLNYDYGLGHLVILDKNYDIKFYQARGFTVRNESLKEILSGSKFQEKNVVRAEIDLIGKHLLDVHEDISPISEFIATASGQKSVEFDNMFYDINSRPTLCTMRRLNGEFQGGFLKINDLSEVCRLKDERNRIKDELENHIRLSDDYELAMEVFKDYVGDSKKVRDLKYSSLKASNMDSNVLLTGKSGTGKNLLAELIHKNSKRANEKFIHINCAAIPENLIESELFGYEKGAFSGALSTGKKGLLEIVDGGTLFLDEIGELSYSMQAKLLEVIQDKSFFRISGNKKVKVDFRLICATNKDLVKEIKETNFREDLYYRINVLSIHVPQLNERKADIKLLVKSIALKKWPDREYTFSDKYIKELMRYDFPGNIRELENIVERSVAMSKSSIIDSFEEYSSVEAKSEAGSLKDMMEEFEKSTIISYLEKYDNDRHLVMEKLGMKKTSFYDKLKKYGIPK